MAPPQNVLLPISREILIAVGRHFVLKSQRKSGLIKGPDVNRDWLLSQTLHTLFHPRNSDERKLIRSLTASLQRRVHGDQDQGGSLPSLSPSRDPWG